MSARIGLYAMNHLRGLLNHLWVLPLVSLPLYVIIASIPKARKAPYLLLSVSLPGLFLTWWSLFEATIGFRSMSFSGQAVNLGLALAFFPTVVVCPLVVAWAIVRFFRCWVLGETLPPITRWTLVKSSILLILYMYTDFWRYAFGRSGSTGW